MRQILLITTLVFSLLACSKDNEVNPLRMSNTATIEIKSDTKYYLAVAYLTKDKWGQEEPYIVDTILTGPATINFEVAKEQNFMYSIQMKEFPGEVEATLKYKEHNKTKSFTGSGNLYDLYEFYKQAL